MHAQQLPPHAAAAAAAHGPLPLMPHALAGNLPPMPPGAAGAAGLLALGGPPGHHMPSVAAAMAAANSSAAAAAAAASAAMKESRSGPDNDQISSKRSNSGMYLLIDFVEFIRLIHFHFFLSFTVHSSEDRQVCNCFIVF